MSSKRFLITGATGTIGANGRKTVELLLERGHQVRGVRWAEKRAGVLKKLNASGTANRGERAASHQAQTMSLSSCPFIEWNFKIYIL
jgi:nucleoside-diphosphate-sugar epimerase